MTATGAALAGLFAAAVGLAGPLHLPSAAAAAGVTPHTYAPDPTGVFANPERGFYSDIEKFQTLDAKAAAKFRDKEGPDLVLVHGIVDLSQYTVRDVDQPLLDGLDTAFAALRANGLKVVLRFSYSPNLPAGARTACDREVVPPVYPAPGGVPPDAPIEIVQQQLHTLSPVLKQNVDVISAFEAGFAGEWGEWHCSSNLLLSKAHIGQLVSALMTELPSSRQVALRYPQDVFTFARQYDRVGNHQDCYAADANDAGTWSTDPSVMAQQMQAIGALGQHTIIGGTACSRSPRTTCTIAALGSATTPPELPEMHFSFLMYPFEETALAAYSTAPQSPAGVNCLNPTGAGVSIQRQLGYRFELSQATFADAASPGRPYDVSITLTNRGWASPYNLRPIFLVLEGATGRTLTPVKADPRSWEPGQTTTIKASIPVPATASGTYRLSLWLPDQSETLRTGPRVGDYSVRFANIGVWQQNTGLNVLSTSVQIQGSASSTTSPSSITTSSTTTSTTNQVPTSSPASTTPAATTATISEAPRTGMELAATGMSPWPLAFGVGLIGIGIGLVAVARRHQQGTG